MAVSTKATPPHPRNAEGAAKRGFPSLPVGKKKDAITLINHAAQTGATELDLADKGLTELPPKLFQLTHLTRLTLRYNQLTTLPPAIAHLNRLTDLDLWDNQLAALPLEIFRLSQLADLNLGRNRLESLPPEVGRLTRLRDLWLSANSLSKLPREIEALTSLTTLGLHTCQFTVLPPEVFRLTRLQQLSLFRNYLTTLPPEIGQLARLAELSLSGNQLTKLPAEITRLSKLKQLYLHDNPKVELPPEILGPRGVDVHIGKATPASPAAVLDYYFRRLRGPTRPLNEAKVILVGQGSVGKTSLVKKIVTGTFNKREKKTDGIYINKEWRVGGNGGKGNEVQVNFWDFGGQEIMHATHQFFLTRRTVYLLVLDARKGENESNIHYWLKIIRSYGGDAPVLVVTNKCETYHLDLNETRLKNDYPNICGFYKTSCENGTGIAELKKAIAGQIHSRAMRHVFDPLPNVYFTIKEELETLARDKNYIDIREYIQLCADKGVKKKDEQDGLLRFLHDLGAVLCFNDPENPYSLRETNVLNPEWVTDGVYKILNADELGESGGVLTKAGLVRVLKNRRHPQECHPFIIGMMRKFELCFAIKEGQKWLVAEKLPANEPTNIQEAANALTFRMHYDVLPAGIICRFIVRRYENLTKPAIYWRSGVVLGIEGCKVLVRSDKDKGDMFISVTGPENRRRGALAVIRDEFDRIHATINLTPQMLVPLPDNPAVAVDYEHLLILEKQRTARFLPQGATEEYGVAQLLDGIEDPLDRQLGRFHLYPPFFAIQPGEESFPDAWEIFCCEVLNRHEETTKIVRRKAPEGGVDLLWREQRRAYQCKSVLDPATSRFDVTKAIESIKAAIGCRKETGWKKFYICSNVDITGPQEQKLRKACPGVDLKLMTPSFWLPRCREQHEHLRNRFNDLVPRSSRA